MPDKKKILIIEDDSALVRSLMSALEDSGFEVISAIDGETGMRTMERESPNLIILDIILPLKSGFEVMQEIQSRPDLKSIPILILTNLESNQNVEQMMSMGAKGYLVKANYSLTEIVNKVKEILTE